MSATHTSTIVAPRAQFGQSQWRNKQVDDQGIAEVAGVAAKVEDQLKPRPANGGWGGYALRAWAGCSWYPDSWQHHPDESRNADEVHSDHAPRRLLRDSVRHDRKSGGRESFTMETN